VKSVIHALIPLLIAILVLSSVDIGYESGTQPDPDSLTAHDEYELNGVFWGAAYRKTRPPFGEPRGVYLLDVHLPRLPRFFPGIVLVPMGPSNRAFAIAAWLFAFVVWLSGLVLWRIFRRLWRAARHHPWSLLSPHNIVMVPAFVVTALIFTVLALMYPIAFILALIATLVATAAQEWGRTLPVFHSRR